MGIVHGTRSPQIQRGDFPVNGVDDHVPGAAVRRAQRLERELGKAVGMAFVDQRTVVSGGRDTTALRWDLSGKGLGKGEAQSLTDSELEAFWKDLSSPEAAAAFRAHWTLVSAPVQAVPLLQDRLRPLLGVDAKRIAKLIEDLNDDEFKVRERATLDLENLGELAAPSLTKALKESPPLEARRRIERIQEKLKGPIDWALERTRIHRAIAALEFIASPAARLLLENLVKSAPEAELVQDAKESLERMEHKKKLSNLSSMTKN